MTELHDYQDKAQPDQGYVFSSVSNAVKLPCIKAHLIFWLTIIAGVTLDLWTKAAVFKWLHPSETFSVIDNFLQFVVAINDGAAFGLASGQRFLLVAVSVISLIAIIGVFLFGKIQNKLVYIALALFAGGVCGNLYDRIFNDGFVRDFIDVYYKGHHWPAFNVADSILCIGVALLIISGFFTEKLSQKHAPQHK